MPTSRVQLLRSNGSFNVKLTLTNPGDATWYTGVGIDHGGVAQDPGVAIAFEAWRQGTQSTKIRRIEIDPKTIYIETDFGEGNQYELWLAISSSQQYVDIQIDKSLGPYDSLGDFYVNSAVASTASPGSAGAQQIVNVQLW
jgi:hypothetical protein